MDEAEYAPRQYAKDGGITEVDFRSLAKSHDKSAIPNRDPSHASGGKRKRDEEADGVEDMDAEAGAVGVEGGVEVPSSKRRAYDNVSGKVSHRPWKAAYTRASAIAGRAPSDWDAKMREKAQKKAIQGHVAELRKEARDKATAERLRREEAKKRKEQNRKKSAIVQKITNPAKLKKMSKKQAKRLVTVAD